MPDLELHGQHGLLQLFEIGAFPVFPGQADDLHGDRARPALDPPGAEVLTHGPGHGQRVDSRMEVEPAVLETDEDAEKSLGDAIARREAPLAIPGRTGPEELALGAEKHR